MAALPKVPAAVVGKADAAGAASVSVTLFNLADGTTDGSQHPDDSGSGAPGTIGDHVTGSDGDDVIHGTPGDDHIAGGDGDDVINGHEGDDTLLGEDGDDQLIGDLATTCWTAAPATTSSWGRQSSRCRSTRDGRRTSASSG